MWTGGCGVGDIPGRGLALAEEQSTALCKVWGSRGCIQSEQMLLRPPEALS